MSDHVLKPGCYGVQAADDDAEAILHSQGPAQGFNGRCRDDLTRQVLKDSLAVEARMVWLPRSMEANGDRLRPHVC